MGNLSSRDDRAALALADCRAFLVEAMSTHRQQIVDALSEQHEKDRRSVTGLVEIMEDGTTVEKEAPAEQIPHRSAPRYWLFRRNMDEEITKRMTKVLGKIPSKLVLEEGEWMEWLNFIEARAVTITTAKHGTGLRKRCKR